MNKRNVKLIILGFISFWCYSSLASGYTITFENNTGLEPDSYMICIQGYANQTPLLELKLDSGSNYIFKPITYTGSTDLPAYPVTPGTSGTTVTVNASVQTLQGARIYYYVAPKASACDSFLRYTGSAVSNNFKAGGAYVFSELTSEAANSNYFDLSQVDSFALPSQAYTTGTTAGYDTLGQSLVSLTSPQNLQAIRADFISAMTSLGSAGDPYKRLATESFSDEGKGYSYPSGTGPVLNPHSFLSKQISPPPASGIVYPGANSALNSIFDASLKALFASTIYVNKTGLSGDTYMGVPVSSGLQYPSGTTPPNAHLPATLPGMIFCNEANSKDCTIATSSFTAYNPAGMTIYNLGATGNYGYITGTLAGNSCTIQLDDPLNVGDLVDTSLFPNGIQGWYVTGSTGPFSQSATYYVDSCTPDCTSSAVTSITLDSGLPTQSTPISGQLILQAWNLASGALAPSSGDSVFGNVGVLGGISWSTCNPDIINVLVTALNRGVSGLRNSQHVITDITHTDSYVWSQETNWYPANTIMNEYANYLHTRELGGKPLFARPNSPAQSAQNMTMGMAYGFGYDENPMNGVIGPQVPAEWGGNVNDNAHIVVTFGPWLSESPTQNAYVSSDGDCGDKQPCYDSIQKAIDEAATGSVILVKQGTYPGSIFLGSKKSLLIKGGYNSTYDQQTAGTTYIEGVEQTNIQATSGSLKFQMINVR